MIDILLYALAAFLAGVLTFLAPCTLPILPAYLAYSTSSERKKITANTFFFGLGLALIFTIMGIASGSIGSLLINYKRSIVYVFAVILIIFGIMSILGKNIKLFKNTNLDTKKTPWGSFVFGGFFAITWSGCIGPVLGFMLILAANTQTMIGGGMLLFIYALGLVFPLLIVSLWLDKLPKDSKIWRILRGKLFEIKFWNKKYYIHSTNLISGALFILLGIYFIFEAKFYVTGFFPQSITEWVFSMQDSIMNTFNLIK